MGLGPGDTGFSTSLPGEIAWLGEPCRDEKQASGMVPYLVQEESMKLFQEQLLELMASTSWGVPVRDMEGLLAFGKEAIGPVMAFLERGLAKPGHGGDLLWATVILGELKSPEGIPLLLRLIQEAEGLEVPIAAAEGLAKIGKPALEAVARLLGEKPEPKTRIFLYAALSGIGTREAWDMLLEALEEDQELDFVVARALAERAHPGDEEIIYKAYLQAESWKRAPFEETMAGMLGGRCPWSVPFKDWRLRYRRQPRQGLKVHRSWPDVLIMLWENRHLLRPDPQAETVSLEELKQKARARKGESVCPDCGQVFRSPTGIPLCEEVEEDLIEFQLQRVREWLAHKWEDIHEVLDELDRHEMEALQLPEESDEERTWKGEALDSIEVVKDTLSWMVEQGMSGLSQGERRLWAALQRARSRVK